MQYMINGFVINDNGSHDGHEIYEQVVLQDTYLANEIYSDNKMIAGSVIDIGADVGFFSVLCKTLWPTCELYSIEKDSSKFEALQGNVRDFYSVKTFNKDDVVISDLFKSEKISECSLLKIGCEERSYQVIDDLHSNDLLKNVCWIRGNYCLDNQSDMYNMTYNMSKTHECTWHQIGNDPSSGLFVAHRK